MNKCNLCPRQCNIDRKNSVGFCLSHENMVVSKTMLHHWEEPCISGSMGSGAIFFSGCTLKCVYCQNREISRLPKGKEMDVQTLAELFLQLQDMGAHTLDLVTPTHFANIIVTVSRLRLMK